MKRTYRTVGALLALASATFAVSPQPAQAATGRCPAGSRVAVVGDSLTVDSADYTKWLIAANGYRLAGFDAQYGRRSTVSYSLLGTMVTSATSAIDTIKRRANVDCWVLAIGTNDVGMQADTSKYPTYITSMTRLIGKTKPIFILDVNVEGGAYSGLPGAADREGNWNHAVYTLSSTTYPNVRYVGYSGLIAGNPALLQPDGIHLTDDGSLQRAIVLVNALAGGV